MFTGPVQAQPAAPSLSNDQQTAIKAVEDGKTKLDDGFYALMENASNWDYDLLPAAPKLNVKAITQSPSEYRGNLFEIEGTFVGLHEVFQVSRRGPWSTKLEQWAIEDAESKELVMVYLVGPPAFPIKGTQVKTVGRFYRVWPNAEADTGQSIEQKSFLVFVGRTAEVHYEGALPALNSTQRLQLQTSNDFSRDIELPPFFVLLRNAASWPEKPNANPPLITHIAPLIAAPDEYRGSLLRVEGILAERRKMRTSQRGPWGDNVEQWVIRITELKDPRDESVAVYLTHPPEGLASGDRVQLVARFYKVWRDIRSTKAENNIPFNITVLVGKTAEPLSTSPRTAVASEGWSSSGSLVQAGLVAMAIIGFGLFLVRRHMVRLKAGGAADLVEFRRQARIEQRAARGESPDASATTDADEAEDAPPLPKDPADALNALERRSLDENEV